jgi:phosphohistidine phosphatase
VPNVLYVLRHAIALERGTPGYADDQRPLTEEGIVKMRRIAAGMEAMGLSFDLILSSPYVRARHTAEIVARRFDAGPLLRLSENLEPGGNPRTLMEEIADAKDAGGVMIVGHEPYLSSLISTLLTGKDEVGMTLKKGGLCKLSLDQPHLGKCASLEWLLTPGQLRRIGRS